VVSLLLAGGANTEATDQVRRSEGDGAQGIIDALLNSTYSLNDTY